MAAMRELLLMRHGKSDWEADFESDLERPLAKRGRKAAARMGRFLAAVGRVPDLVLCSPAARARETVEIAAVAGEWGCPVEVVEGLYGGDAEGVIETLIQVPEEQARVMVVGHEPVWSQLVARLTGGGAVAMPTAAVASVRFLDCGWAELAPGRGTLQWLVTPRLLEGLGLG
jgi:phosphohistidine phosphatase